MLSCIYYINLTLYSPSLDDDVLQVESLSCLMFNMLHCLRLLRAREAEANLHTLMVQDTMQKRKTIAQMKQINQEAKKEIMKIHEHIKKISSSKNTNDNTGNTDVIME